MVLDEASLSVMRDLVRSVAERDDVPSEVAARAAIVVSELGRNHLRHAVGGRIAVSSITRGEHRGIEIVAADAGPGIVDIASGIDAPARAEGSLGVGVGSVFRLSSEVDVDVRRGEGTCVVARLFDRETPRRREVGVYGRPLGGERVSGDHAGFRRELDALVLAVCDGLGHGPSARDASDAAMSVFHELASENATRVFEQCRVRLADERGVVMSITRIDEALSTMTTSTIGNIDVQVCAPRSSRRFGSVSGVLGGRPFAASTRVPVESAALEKQDVVVLATDGISSKLSIEQDFTLLRMHPIVLAQRIVERFERTNDDALVLVSR